LWPLGCKNVQKNIEMIASCRKNELKKLLVYAQRTMISIFGTHEASCFPNIMVEKRLLSEVCNRHP
jgi:hypothetical protein